MGKNETKLIDLWFIIIKKSKILISGCSKRLHLIPWMLKYVKSKDNKTLISYTNLVFN